MAPLTFSIPQIATTDVSTSGEQQQQQQQPPLKIQIHQVDASEPEHQHNTGFVMWPAAVMLSKYIAQNPRLVLDRQPGDVLELGAGCGLTGLTAAVMLRNQQEQEQIDGTTTATSASCNVIFTDYNPEVLENLDRNIRLNQLDVKSHSVVGLDFFDQPEASQYDDSNEEAKEESWVDMNGTRRTQVGLVLGADILCYSNDADLVANTLVAALVEGGQALVLGGDEDHRFGVKGFAEACRNVGLNVNVRTDLGQETTTTTMEQPSTVIDNNNDQSDGATAAAAQQWEHDLAKTNGYEQGYNFTMFDIHKPMSKKLR